MKYKVGDKVRVRSDLVLGSYYGGYLFNRDMALKKGLETTVTAVFNEYYLLKNDVDVWGWTDEMLEPVETFNVGDVDVWGWTDEMLEPVETFNVGDVVYDKSGNKGEVNALSYLVLFEKAQYTMYANELSKTKPLQKISRKELADKGYELVE